MEMDADVLDWVLRGGEDYQLLFTTGASDEQALQQLVTDKFGREVFCIGRIVEGRGVFLGNGDGNGKEISYQGYDHFTGK